MLMLFYCCSILICIEYVRIIIGFNMKATSTTPPNKNTNMYVMTLDILHSLRRTKKNSYEKCTFFREVNTCVALNLLVQ